MRKPQARDPSSLADMRARSVGYHLISCAFVWNAQAIARINDEVGRTMLRDAHTRLFPHIGFESIRLVELARRVGVTKQAISPLVADMEREGVVELVADADDARAKRVRLTAKGQRAFVHGTGVLLDIEDELAPVVGKATLARLRKDLTRLHEALARREAEMLAMRS